MLMLSLTSQRTRCTHPEIAALIDQGDISRAIDVGRSQVERELPTLHATDRAPLGQLLGRCLLMTGREEDAEDLFRRLARTYGEVSRAHVRWLSGLDQGVMLLHLNRPSRAAESFCAVADDPAADVALRVEAMAGAAIALHRAGDCRSASRSLAAARRLCAGALDPASIELVDGIGLELAALQRSRSSRPMDDHAMHDVYCEGTSELATLECLRSQLLDAAARFESRMPMVARRLRSLAHATGPAAGSAQLIELLSWVRARRLAGLEPELRVESAMLMIASGAVGAVAEVLSPQIGDEIKLRRSRHAVDLHYLMSRLSLSQGRAADALRWYRSHSQEAIRALSGHGSRRLATSYLHVAPTGDAGADEAARARLPLRYRRAHQFILDHLHDENLSVQRVAVELGVTERALQMAFRNHLGLTPTEFIRTRRVERVHEDLVNGAGEHDLMQLAQRHGIRNRSTLSSNYRSRFAETPMQTLRGGAGTVHATVI